MKKLMLVLFVLALLLPSAVFAGKPVPDSCTTIQSGTLLNSAGDVLTTGYDVWGYNYQAHMFNGGYCDAYRDAAWCQPYKDVQVIMKWNDAWLSNKDCDGDGKLDRHYGFASYIGSGAWETNHSQVSILTLARHASGPTSPRLQQSQPTPRKSLEFGTRLMAQRSAPTSGVSLPPSRKSITIRAPVTMGFSTRARQELGSASGDMIDRMALL